MSKLWYNTPANGDWNRALPIGNGRLGAMIFGEETYEHYQLNEESLWSGGPMERVNPDAKPNLEKVRRLIFDGKIPEAERLLKYAFTATPQSERSYQTLGDFYLDLMDTIQSPTNYKRELDLENAIHTVTVKDNISGIAYTRETFASTVSDCILIRLSADQPESISVGATLSRQCFYDKSWHTDDAVFISGSQGKEGIDFCAGIQMKVVRGSIHALGEHVFTEHADEVVIALTAKTSFYSDCPEQEVEMCLNQALAKEYALQKNEHVQEYQKYFMETSLKLSDVKDNSKLPTDERLAIFDAEHPDNGLIQTYFDFGRYLLISCSRPGTLPANLQGIWNQDMAPAWGSKYTININTEMNYWPAEMLGLSECHMPLFDLLERMVPRGQKTAKDMYGCRGFVAHHNTDIWADTAPQDMYTPATIWPMGGAWLCTHIWTHYEYTKDENFLRRMYPVIREAVLFFMDYLVEYKGNYVTTPSVSPENTYILPDGTRGCVCFGPAMDHEILHDLFESFIEEAEIVKEEDVEFVQKAKAYLEKIPSVQIGSKGQILEWFEEYDEAEPGHRHISQLYALFPSNQIRKGVTEKLVNAAEKTLEGRLSHGGGHTGWSRAWIINLYARLWDADKAYSNLTALLKRSTLPNLFDNHPPFQIDGNFGAICGIGEMLVQSFSDSVILLPALPKEWDNGSMKGLHLRGNASLDISWEKGALVFYKIQANTEYETTIIYGETRTHIHLKKGEMVTKTVM